MQVDLHADITPALGLGGFRVGALIREFSTLVSALDLRHEVAYELVSLYEARYRLGAGAIEVVVDVRNGKIARVTAYEGYRGVLFGAIRPGMTAREVMQHESRLHYNEAESLILCRGVDGISLDVAESDPDPERVPELTIMAVSVFSPALNTAAGQRGDW